MTSTIPTVRLRRGADIPVLGLGTWPMDDAQAARVVPRAIEAGYRLIDTAENYRNERGVGRGLRAAGVARDEVFVTTKFNVAWHGRDLVRQAIRASADRLGLDRLDLVLIHWPNPAHGRYVEAWLGLLDAFGAGEVGAVGVSNFKPAHLQRLLEVSGQLPDVNQIQLHPTAARAAERAYHAEQGIHTQSWSPLGRGAAHLLAQPAVTEPVWRYGKTAAQVVLRWHLDLGLGAVPKSADPARLAENADLFDFHLSAAEIEAISALDDPGVVVDADSFGH